MYHLWHKAVFYLFSFIVDAPYILLWLSSSSLVLSRAFSGPLCGSGLEKNSQWSKWQTENRADIFSLFVLFQVVLQ